jgi:acetylornithine deacetylase/succinyl-diaminopimelate desuccinylase-like protein
MSGIPTMKDDERKLVNAIDEREVINYCKKLINIPSIFGSEHELSDQVARDLRDFKLQTTSVPVDKCGPSVVGLYLTESDGQNSHRDFPGLIFNGHMDTVQVCEGWTRDPFTATVEGDKLYGLGSVDMKCGLAAMIMAAKALVSARIPLKRAFAIHAVSDEEAWGRGTATLIDRGFYDRAKCCIVGEPSNLERLRNARRGTRVIDVIATGRSTHGAQPENGLNAICEAAKVITALSKLPDKTHSRIVDFKLQPLKTSSCILKIEGGSDALRVPDRCVIRLDRHILPGTTTHDSLEEVKSFLDLNLDKETRSRVRIEFTPLPQYASPYEPFETDPKSELVKTILNVSSIFGYNPLLVGGHSVADDCLIAARCNIPVVSYGPCGEINTHASGRAHESDEYVYTQQVIDAAKIYAVVAYRILNSMN